MVMMWVIVAGGLWNGAAACMLRDASFSAILFPTYQASKAALIASPALAAAGPLYLFISGLLAAAPAAFFTTPCASPARQSAPAKARPPAYPPGGSCARGAVSMW